MTMSSQVRNCGPESTMGLLAVSARYASQAIQLKNASADRARARRRIGARRLVAALAGPVLPGPTAGLSGVPLTGPMPLLRLRDLDAESLHKCLVQVEYRLEIAAAVFL